MNKFKRIFEWCPQPSKPILTKSTKSAPPAPLFFRVGGLLLSAVGGCLLAIFLFSGLVFFVSGFNLSSLGSLFPITFFAGIIFAATGITLSAHSMQSYTQFLRKPCLIAGLTLLTLSVFFSIFEILEATQMTAPQFGLLIAPYEVYFSFAAFAGGLILFIGLLKWSVLPGLLKKSYCALAIGAVISLSNALVSLFHLYPTTGPSASVITVWINPALLFSFVIYPIGALCLILGWAGVFSFNMKRSKR